MDQQEKNSPKYFSGKITLKTIISFIDNKNFNFNKLFEDIKKINSNALKKSEEEHFTSVIFGKLAEIFVFQNLKQELNLKNNNFIFSPLNEQGYEKADIAINFTNFDNQTIEKLIEVRSSFQKNIYGELNHIIRYINGYKKIETYKDYYFQVFFEEDKKEIINKINNLFNLYKKYKTEIINNYQQDFSKLSFSNFLKQTSFNVEENELICKIINRSFIHKDEIENYLKEPLNSKIMKKNLNQTNTVFEAKLLKDCLTSKESIELIKQDLNLVKNNLIFNKIKH